MSIPEVVSMVDGGCAIVVVDGDGVVSAIEARPRPVGPAPPLLLPAPVDVHLDVVRERRRPRATVELPLEQVILALDGEVAAAGIATVCLAARFEEEPAKGVSLRDAVELCRVIQAFADTLACRWLIHARVEINEPEAADALAEVLDLPVVVLVSVMDHSEERSRFASAAAHRAFYAQDWGVSSGDVVAILDRRRQGAAGADDRRHRVASMVLARGLSLASHDDRNVDDVVEAATLGATVCEFPLTLAAAEEARTRGLRVVLGAPNVVRGRSTSPGNLLARDAVAAGACDVLCSDYLPGSVLPAVTGLVQSGTASLAAAAALVTTGPAALLGLPAPTIKVDRPLDAVLLGDHIQGLWRGGRRVFSRGS